MKPIIDANGSWSCKNTKYLKKFVLTCMVTGAVLAPKMSSAMITDGSGAQLDTAPAAATDIYAQKIDTASKTGINHFEKFDVEPSKIVNIQFKGKQDSTVLNNVVNMVNDDINIKGTVNGIRDGKIGGDLYFLTPGGIAVSGDGVINAGSLTMMTVSNDAYQDMEKKLGLTSGSGNNADDLKNTLNTILTKPETIALNSGGLLLGGSGGAISIEGKIRTHGGITLRAGKSITTGQEGTTDTVLQTGIASFLTGGNASTGVNDISRADNGDIVLSVVNNNQRNVNDSNAAVKQVHAGIVSYGTLQTDGAITLQAEATSDRHRAIMADSSVDVYGTLKGKDINVSANSTMNLSEATAEHDLGARTVDVLEKVVGKAGLTVQQNYSLSGTRAQVTIRKGATVEGTGNVSIKANTNAAVKLNSESVPSDHFSSSVATLQGAFMDSKNDANVTVDGTVEAGKRDTDDVKADNVSTLTISADSKASVSSQILRAAQNRDTPVADVAAAVLLGHNKANVHLGEDALVKNTGVGDTNITSSANTSMVDTIKSTGAGKDTADISFNYVDFDTNSLTSARSAVKANGNLTITGHTTMANNKISTLSNVAVKTLFGRIAGSGTAGVVAGRAAGANSVLDTVLAKFFNTGNNKILQGISDKMKGDLPESSLKEFTGKYQADATVQWVKEDNTSRVIIGSKPIVALGDATINATTDARNTKMAAHGQITAQQTNQGTAVITFMGSSINNASGVQVEGEKTVTADDVSNQKTGVYGKTVSISSATHHDYQLLKDMINKVKADLTSLGNIMTPSDLPSDSDESKSLTNFSDSIGDLGDAAGLISGGNDSSPRTKNLAVALGKAAFAYETLESNFQNIEEKIETQSGSSTMGGGHSNNIIAVLNRLKDDAKQLKDLSTFATYYVSSTMAEAQPNSENKFGGAATVRYVSDATNSNVVIGKNAVVKASAGDVQIGSQSTGQIISFAGKSSKVKDIFPVGADGKSAVAVGATVGFTNIGMDSTTLVNQNAQVEAKKNVNIDAEGQFNNADVTFTAGKSGSFGLSGMVGASLGNSRVMSLVDDDAVIKAGDNININGINNTMITNIAGGFAMGNSTTIGAAGAINISDKDSIAGVIDMEASDSSTTTTPQTVKAKAADKVTRARKLVKDFAGSLNDLVDDQGEKVAMFGTEDVDNSTKGLYGKKVLINSKDGGMINAVAAAGALSKGENQQQSDGAQGGQEKPGFFKSLMNMVDNGKRALNDTIGKGFDSIDNAMLGNTNSGYSPVAAVNQGVPTSDSSASGEITGDNEKSLVSENSQSSKDKAKIAGAGSVALNIINGETASLLSGANVVINHDSTDAAGDQKGLSLKAFNNSFTGAWAGSAALGWAKPGGQSSGGGSAVGISGAVGLNFLSRGTDSIIDSSDISDAQYIDNNAIVHGSAVAAGLGVAAAINSGGSSSSTAVSASVSLNKIDNDDLAVMLNTNTKTTTATATATAHSTTPGVAAPNPTTGESTAQPVDINNTVYNDALQVTGGISASIAAGGSSQTAAGATVSVGLINNTISSAIIGGTYNTVKSMNVKSIVGLKQIGVAAAIGVSVGGNAKSLEGALTYDSVTNNVISTIAGANIVKASTAAGDAINVGTQDYTNSPDGNAFNQYVADHGITTKKSDYTKRVKRGDNQSDNDKNYDKMIDDQANDSKGKNGELIVSGSLVLAASSGTAAGAAISISNINNHYTSTIQGNTKIGTAGDIAVTSDVAPTLIGIAGGIGGSGGKFAAVGSVNWENLSSDTNAYIANTVDNNIVGDDETEQPSITIGKVNKLDVSSTNSGLAVGVAGQISAGQSAAGLAIAYHGLDNGTKAFVKGADITATSGSVDVNATSKTKIVTVGAGISASANTSLNGNVAVNRGKNDTQAYVDGSTIQSSTLNVNGSDQTTITGIAAGITGSSGNVAVGAALALNDIGGYSAQGTKSTQNVSSKIEGSNITVDKKINVNANDNAHMITVAAGVAGSAGVGVQGAGAASLINKNVEASIDNSNINNSLASSFGTNSFNPTSTIDVSATNTGRIVGSADIVSVGVVGAGVGVGIGVNRITQGTNAFVNGGNISTKNLYLNAKSLPNILAVGVGGAGGTAAGVAGSFATNFITNNNAANINGATVKALYNVGVISQSDDLLHDIVGTIAGSVNAALGLSTAYNRIGGDTQSTVSGSTIDVVHQTTGDDVDTDSQVDDNAVLHSIVSKDSFSATGLLDGRKKDTTKRGLVVDSSATHSISSQLATGGGAGSIAVFGTVNIHKIDGNTTAQVKDSKINQSAGTNAGDVYVHSADYGNSAAFILTAGGSGSAAAAVTSDTNLVGRSTTATIANTSKDTGSIKSNGLSVTADSKYGLANLDTGVSISGGSAITGTSTVNKVTGMTSASIDKLIGTFKGALVVNANHSDNANMGNVAASATAGVAAGLGVGVALQKGNVYAGVTDSTLKSANTGNSDTSSIYIKAINRNRLNTLLVSGGVAGTAGIAGTVAVNNYNQNVKTEVANSTLVGGKADIGSEEYFTTINNGGVLGGGLDAGIGASVTVNTFSDNIKTIVSSKSTIQATNGDINIKSVVARDSEQTVVSGAIGGVAVAANIAVTNINKHADDDQDKDVKKNNDELKKRIETANDLRSKNTKKLSFAGLDSDDTKALSGEAFGEIKANEVNKNGGVLTQVSGAQLKASSAISVNANETNDVNMRGGSLSGGVVSVSGAVGVLNVGHDTNVVTDGSTMEAKFIHVGASTGSASPDGIKLDILQGQGGAVGLGAAVAVTQSHGTVGVDLGDSQFVGFNAFDAKAIDDSKVSSSAKGITVSGLSASAIVSKASNDSSVEMKGEGVKISGQPAANVTILADKANTVRSNAVSGSVGIGSIEAAVSNVSDAGHSTVNFTKGSDPNSNSTFGGGYIDVQAKNRSSAQGSINTLSVKLLDAGGSSGTASNTGTASVNIDPSTTFNGYATLIQSSVEQLDNNTPNAGMDVLSIGVAAGASVKINSAYVSNTMAASTNVDQAGFSSNDDVTIKSNSSATGKSKINGLAVGGVFASGTNKGKVLNQSTATTKVIGSNDSTKPTQTHNFTVGASNVADGSLNTVGNGGGIINISPMAGTNTSQSINSTTVDLSGNWNVLGNLDVRIGQGMTVNSVVDVTGAGVINASGASSTLLNWGKSSINVHNGNIESFGYQSYSIDNNLNIHADVHGNGYGLGAGASSTIDSPDPKSKTITKGTNIDSTITFDGAHIKTNGSKNSNISAQVTTGGTIEYNIESKSAGAIAGTYGEVNSDISIANKVETKGDTSITTSNGDSSIGFGAVDNLTPKIINNADTQGGAVGATSAETTSIFSRSNTIDIGGQTKLYSNYDITFNAGRGLDNQVAQLNYTAVASALNHAVLPIGDPTLKNIMHQSNIVNIGQGASATAIRNINFSAERGISQVLTMAKWYKWLGGADAKGNLTSSLLGKYSRDESVDNHIQIDGNLLSGVHSHLGMTIKSYDGSINVGSSSASVGFYKPNNSNDVYVPFELDGESAWFTKTKWYADNVKIFNGSPYIKTSVWKNSTELFKQYNDDLSKMNQYQKDSDNYNTLKNQVDLLERRMIASGDAYKASDGTLQLYSSANSGSVSVDVPAVTVSGGNISFDTDGGKYDIRGGGSITLKANPYLGIINKSQALLVIEGAKIASSGGKIMVNGGYVNQKKDIGAEFSGPLALDSLQSGKSTILLQNTSSGKYENGILVNPSDLVIRGTVENNARNADIQVKNDHFSILVEKGGSINSAGTMEISAPNGSFTMSSPTAVENIGNNITNLFIGDNEDFTTIAQKLYIRYIETRNNGAALQWGSWDEFLNWIKTNYDFDRTKAEDQADRELAEIARRFGRHYVTHLEKKNQDFEKVDSMRGHDFMNNYNPAASSLHAGDDVIIGAGIINVNGLIQSGYDSYKLDLASYKDTVRRLIEAKDRAYHGAPISDDDAISEGQTKGASFNQEYFTVDGNHTVNDSSSEHPFLLIKGGAVFNSAKGYFDSVPDIYYNPSTKHIIVPNIAVKGGFVSLSGIIASAGQGRIYAASGTPDVNLDLSNLGRSVVVDGILNRHIVGRIRIQDYGKLNNNKPTISESVTWGSSAPRGSYTPNSNLWMYDVSGFGSVNVMYHDVIQPYTWWGLRKYSDTDLSNIAIHSDKLPKDVSAVNNVQGPLSNNMQLPNSVAYSTVSNGGSGGSAIVVDVKRVSSSRPVRSETYSYKEPTGPLGWKGLYHNQWSTTTNSIDQVRIALNAHRPISVGFLNSGHDNINIHADGDLIINGVGLSNATSGGAVNLISDKGSITQLNPTNSKIVTNTLRASAGNGIDLTQVAVDPKINTMIDLRSIKGDINYKSLSGNTVEVYAAITGLNNLGDIGSVGSITYNTGAVNLSVSNNLVGRNASTPYEVYGRRVDLHADGGYIGTESKALRVTAGDKVYSSNTAASSINATAQDDINIVQNTPGDMRIGHITSKTGTVRLTVNKGNFVDAVGTTDDADEAATKAAIKAWTDAGMLSSQDAVDQSTQSAASAKNERQQPLVDKLTYIVKNSPEFKTYRDNHATDAASNLFDTLKQTMYTNSEVKEQYKKYVSIARTGTAAEAQTARNNLVKLILEKAGLSYITIEKPTKISAGDSKQNTGLPTVSLLALNGSPSDGLTENTDGISSTADVKQKDDELTEDTVNLIVSIYGAFDPTNTYGWSKQSLIYAIQDGIVNPTAGSGVFVKSPNITAHDISLTNVTDGGVGNTDPQITIKYKDIDQVNNLRILANATSNDVTWGPDSVVVKRERSVTLGINDPNGHVSISTKQNRDVFISSDKDSKMQVSKINAGTGDVKIEGAKGVIGIANGVDPMITARNLIVNGGSETIGASADNPLTVDLSGMAQVNAIKGIYLKAVGNNDLDLISAAAEGPIDLKAKNNIKMTHELGKDMGYINTTGNIILDSENGTIGEATTHQNQQGEDVFDGIRILGGTGAKVTASGKNVYLSGIKKGTDPAPIILHDIQAKDDNGAIKVLSDGGIVVDQNTDKDKTLDAKKSIILTTKDNDIELNGIVNVNNGQALSDNGTALTLEAKKGSLTEGTTGGIKANKVVAHGNNNIDLNSENNSFAFINLGGTDGEVTGDSDVVSANDALTVNFDSNFKGDVSLANHKDGGTVTLANDLTTDATAPTDSKAKRKGDVTVKATGKITASGKVTTSGNVDVQTTKGGIEAQKDITSQGNVSLTTKQSDGNSNIDVEGIVNSTGTVTATTDNGDVKFAKNLTSTEGNINATTKKGNITLGGDTKTNKGAIDLTTTTGKIDTQGSVNGAGKISFTTNKGDIQTAAVTGSDTVDLKTTTGAISTGAVTGTKAIDLKTTTGAISTGAVTGSNTIDLKTNDGAITTNGAVNGTGKITVATTKGAIQMKGDVKGQADIALSTAQSDGNSNIDLEGVVTGTGTVTATTDNGDVKFAKNLTSTTGNINATTKKGNITVVGDTKTDKGAIDLTTTTGKIDTQGSVNGAGKISFTTNTGNIQTAAVTGSDTVDLKTTTGDISTGAVTGTKAIDLKTTTGAISTGAVTGSNTIDLKTNDGAITTNGAVNGTGKITVATTKGTIQMKGAVNGQADIALSTAQSDGNSNIDLEGVVTGTGAVTATTDNGNVKFAKNLTSTTGNINATTKKGNITVVGDTKTDKGTIDFTTGTGNINTQGAVTSAGALGFTTNTGNIQTAAVTGSDTVDLKTTTGDISTGAVTGTKAIDLKTTTGAISTGAVTGSNTIDLKTNDGAITTNGAVNGTGKITVATTKGAIQMKGDVNGQDDIALSTAQSDDKSNIDVEGVVTGAGSVTATTNKGDVKFAKNLTSTKGNIQTTTQTGDINLNGITMADLGLINLMTTGGNITATDDVTSQGDLTATTTTGNIKFDKNVKSNTSNIQETTGTGSITNGGTTTANSGKIDLTTGTGDVITKGAVSSQGDITAKTDKGNITAQSTLTTKKNINLKTATTGNIELDNKVTAPETISLQTKAGKIVLKDNMNGDKGISFSTESGNIEFGGGTSHDIMVQSLNGPIQMLVEKEGDIKDSHKEANGYNAHIISGHKDQPKLEEPNANVVIVNKGVNHGLVDLKEIYAKNKAVVSSANDKGQGVILALIDGKLVAIFVKNPDASMDVEHVRAATSVKAQGSLVDFNKLTQREGADNLLELSLGQPDSPMKSLAIDSISTNRGIRIPSLWSYKARLGVQHGRFYLDKVYILDKATLSNGNMITNIYGGPKPIRESKVMNTYWVDTGINNPKDDLVDFHKDGINPQKWMYLRFADHAPEQHSNGNLLNLEDNYRVYNQRYTTVNWYGFMEDNSWLSHKNPLGLQGIPDYMRDNTVTNGYQMMQPNAKKRNIIVDNGQ